MSIEADHYTTPGITENKIFCISLVDEPLLAKVDYAGTVSGKKVEYFIRKEIQEATGRKRSINSWAKQ